jgi:hypothetical protein
LSAVAPFVLPVPFSGLAAFFPQRSPLSAQAVMPPPSSAGRAEAAVGGDEMELNLVVLDGELVAQHLDELDSRRCQGGRRQRASASAPA